MFNVQCSSVGKDKGAAQISKIKRQTLCRSRQTWDLLPPATKEPQNFKIQNDDDDTYTKQPQHKDIGMVNIELLY